MASLIVPGASGLPDDALPDVPCPVMSSVALAHDSTGQMTKVTLEVNCRKRCPWFLERGGRPACAVAVIALEMAGRS